MKLLNKTGWVFIHSIGLSIGCRRLLEIRFFPVTTLTAAEQNNAAARNKAHW